MLLKIYDYNGIIIRGTTMKDITIITKNDNQVKNIVTKEEAPFLEFGSLNEIPFIKHGFSTRLGGVSEGIFSSMNLGYGRGDKDENVLENFHRMGNALGIRVESMVHSKQTHTTNVMIVNEEHMGNGVLRPNSLEDIDGLVTNVPGVCLVTSYADCVPLYLVDPVNKVIGLSHSGWRGTVNKIGSETIRLMKEEFDCKPEDIIVAIGPSICQSCYEVSEDVINEFKNAFTADNWCELFYKKDNGKYQLDLWKSNELIFLEAGISKDHISITNICTCCNSEILFSHRASHGERGNLAAFLAMNQEENYE